MPADAAIRAPAIQLDDLGVAYRGRAAVQGLSGRFEPGSLTAVVGPNGAGKSTLLAAIAGRLRPSRGSVRLEPATAAAIGWMPQQTEIDRSFPLRVFDLVALGCWHRVGALARLDTRSAAAVSDALRQVGLEGLERRLIGELSVGQFQRVLFARVLVQDAPVILLDEPFNAVDARTTADLLAVIHRWHAEARTVIAVLHDLELVRAHFDQTLLLAREAIAWGPTARAVSTEHLGRARLKAESWEDEGASMRVAA